MTQKRNARKATKLTEVQLSSSIRIEVARSGLYFHIEWATKNDEKRRGGEGSGDHLSSSF